MICYVSFIVWCMSTLLLSSQGTPRVIPDGLMIFYALHKISGGLGERTGFIYWIISHLYSILWEGEMFHDLYKLDLGFGHFRHNWLELL